MESLPRLRHAAVTGVGISVRGVLHVFASLVLSTMAYSAIYRAVVPEAELTYPLHFGLCRDDGTAPTGASGGLVGGRASTVALSESSTHAGARASSPRDVPATALAAGYSYTARVCLELPESPPNVNAGTFLTELALFGAADEAEDGGAAPLLFYSSRPFVLRYKSEQLRYLSNLFFLVPLVLGLMEEKQTHCASLTEGFHNSRARPVREIRVSISSCQLQVYSGALQLRTSFGWAGTLMHSWFFTSAAAGIALLMLLYLLLVLAFELREGMGRADQGAGAGDEDGPGFSGVQGSDSWGGAGAGTLPRAPSSVPAVEGLRRRG